MLRDAEYMAPLCLIMHFFMTIEVSLRVSWFLSDCVRQTKTNAADMLLGRNQNSNNSSRTPDKK